MNGSTPIGFLALENCVRPRAGVICGILNEENAGSSQHPLRVVIHVAILGVPAQGVIGAAAQGFPVKPQRFTALGIEPMIMSIDEFRVMVRVEYASWGKTIKEIGIASQ